MRNVFLLIGLSLLLVSGCSNNEEGQVVTISAASSLTDAITEIAEIYEDKHAQSLKLNFASSGKLAQQIQQGAPVDVFLSADAEWMDQLEKSGDIVEDTRTPFVQNGLVLIADAESEALTSLEALTTLPADQQIAIGAPESVPAGTYTKEALQRIQIWDKLHDQMVYANNVRQVLTFVESGNAEYGFIYKSDALLADHAQVLFTIDPSLHRVIEYPGAVLADSQHKEEAQAFLDFLHSEEASTIFALYGFDPVMKEKKTS